VGVADQRDVFGRATESHDRGRFGDQVGGTGTDDGAAQQLVGLGIGLSLAVVVEYSKNCFRSVHDISRVMVVPVLGTINAITTKRETRRVVATRMVMGGAAFMLISMLGYVTWAYKMSPNLLSNQVLETIESFRSHFK